MNQKARVPKLSGRFFKNTDEFLSHDLALFFRILDAGKPSQKSLAGVNAQYLQAQALAEVGENRLEFILPQKTVVDKDTDKPVADGTVDQKRRHGGINAAAEAANGLFITYLARNCADRRLDEGRHRPIAPAAANPCEKVFQDLCAVMGVNHFGMKLKAPNKPRFVRRGGNGLPRAGQDAEAFGKCLDAVAVAHPDLKT